MSSLRATVKDGRLILDQPTTLPEGTILDLVLDDEGDNLTSAERKVLDEAIAKSFEDAKAGLFKPAEELIRDLRAKR